ncbi:hypothetical protein PN36_27840 [Candidatus Thiomargarita nelsonii]|uniref:Sortilin N-terminal domain-containing protein n=1 Tax=Candidatus Thiomargarita nelsonii TaxID=1003181 RepID=A0A0A6RV36_9GAMM|nr:hypothetical protein PN36_27840 [Candidatus Thiomargarita nelsonii]
MHFSTLKVLSRLNAQGILSLGILSISCGTVAFDSAQPVLKEQTLKSQQTTAPAEWRVMPVRSKVEFDQGKLGGEGEQHPHSIARCLNHPEYIYFSQDVAGIWRSKDNGDTWEKALDKGLWVNMGQSIEVDPVDPQTVFLISDNGWNYLDEKRQGLYRSSNGGDNWDYLLPVPTNFSVNHHRIYRHNIAYDPSTITETGAQRWYVAFPASQQSYDSGLNPPEKFPQSKIEAMQLYGGGSYRPAPENPYPENDENENILVSQAALDGGLYRSEDMGVTWTSTPVSSLPGHTTVYAIQTHPTDGQTVYLASNLGLFISDARGENFMPLGNLPAQHHVSSIAINPEDPQIIYVTLYEERVRSWGILKVGKGLYQSQDGGETFSELKEYDAARVFMNPGHPEVLYLSGNYTNSIVSHDGGLTWENMAVNPTHGLSREWKTAMTGEMTGIVGNPNNPNEAVAYSLATLWKTTDGGQTFNENSTLFSGFAWAFYNSGVAFDSFDPQRLAFFNLDVGTTITSTGTDYFEWLNEHAWGWYKTCVVNKGHGGEIREIPCTEEGAIKKILWLGTYSGSFQPIEGSQIIVASIGTYFRTSLMRSEDNGSTWKLVEKAKEDETYHDIFEMNEFVAFHPQAPNIVYAGNKISYDAGQTFVDIDFAEYAQPALPKILGMCLSQPDTVYAMDGYMLQILRSDDRGQTWRLYTQPGWQFLKFDRIPTFAVNPEDCDRIYSFDEKGDLAFFDGSEWHSTGVLALAGGLEVGNFVRTIAIDPNHPEIIYAGMFASGIPGIWRSVDGGDSWEDISNNLPRSNQRSMAVNPHTGSLFTGSPVGTWVFPPPYESDTLIYDKLVSYPE